jgi:hypothetical protein
MTPSTVTSRLKTPLLILFVIVAALAVPRAAHGQTGVEETPLCTVLKDPHAYDHKYVKVRGTIRL